MLLLFQGTLLLIIPSVLLGGMDLLVKLLSKETIQGDEKSFQIKYILWFSLFVRIEAV